MKIRECRVDGIWDIGFIDPDKIHEITVEQFAQDTEDFFANVFKAKK